MTTFAVNSPGNNQLLYEVAEPSDADILWIYKKAGDTFQKIRNLSVDERIKETIKLQKYIIENQENIITRIVQETGKCRTDALTSEIFGVLDVIEYYKKEAAKKLAIPFKKSETYL